MIVVSMAGGNAGQLTTLSARTARSGLPAGATRAWTSESEFRLDVNFIDNINHYTLAVRFQPDQTVEVTIDEASGAEQERKDRRHAGNPVAAPRPRLWLRPPLIEPLSGHPSLTLSPISWPFSLARTGRWPKRRPASAPR
jgi:hypothetical protein